MQAHYCKVCDDDCESNHDQLLIALSQLHKATARINELKHAAVDAMQSERAREKERVDVDGMLWMLWER